MSNNQQIDLPMEEDKKKMPSVLGKFSGPEERELAENLGNQRWRLENLYYIKTKAGQKVRFKPNWAQRILLDNLWFFSIILKARQLGMTTFFCLLYLDCVLFSENKTAGIIAHKEKDAKNFFRDKVRFAWDNLPPTLKDYLGPPNTETVGELSFPNGSKIFVSTSTRSGTCQYLHISEFGKLCATFPGKAEEIVTGAINSVEQGNIVTIESTAEGREGYYYDFCVDAQNAQKENRELSPMEFKFFFFPWWQEESYRVKSGEVVIDQEHADYFDQLFQKHGIVLDDEQKKWYIVKHKTQKDKMKREYPSTPDEAFEASIEGAYYASQMAKVYEQQRIREVPYDSRLLVDTYWDLGMNDTNVVIFAQAFGNEVRIIDVYENTGEGLAHYVNILKEKGYVYGKHVFPHDVEVKELGTGVSRRQTLIDLNMTNIRTVARSKDINDDIEMVRKMFSRFYFDERNTVKLVDALNSYRKEWDDKTGQFKNYPRHDKASHLADALRTLVMGWTDHAVSNNSSNSNEQYQDFF